MDIFNLIGSIRLEGIDAVGSKLNDIGNKMADVGSKISNFGGSLIDNVSKPILGILEESVMLASDLTEVKNVVQVTFGKSADAVIAWSKTLLDKYGMVELESQKYVGSMGAMLKSSGLSADASKTMAEKLVELTGDMSSFYNLGHEEMWRKIRSGISGETEPLKVLGINMSVANLEAFALAEGIKKPWKEMSQSEQTQLRYTYLLEKTKDAQGDFARTSKSFANELRILDGLWKVIETTLGSILLPVLNNVLKVVVNWVEELTKMDSNTMKIILGIALFAAAIGPLIFGFGTLVVITGAVISAFGTIIGAISAIGIPIAIAVVAISSIVVGLTGLLLSSKEVREGIANTFSGIVDKIKEAATFIKNHFKDIKDAFLGLMNGLMSGDWGTFYKALANLVPTDVYIKISEIVNKFEEFRKKAIEVRDKVIEFGIKIGEVLGNIFKTFSDSLSNFKLGDIINSFKDLMLALAPLKDVFIVIASILGGVLALNLGIIIGLWNGMAGAIDNVIGILLNIVGVVTSVFGIIVGVMTGNGAMIEKSVKALWENVKGLFVNAFHAILDFVIGFYNGVVNWFKSLYNAIVGHSIVPDLINGIVNWFKSLPGKILGVISGFVSSVINYFSGLKDKAVNIFNNLKTSISSIWNNIKSTVITIVSNFISSIKSKFDGMKSTLSTSLNGIKSNFSSVWNGIKSTVIDITSSMINKVKDIINGVTGTINNIGKKISGLVSNITNFAGLSIPGFANGVTNFGGGWAIVGENGPELVNLPGNSSVLDAGRTRSMINNNYASNISRSENFIMNGDINIDGKTVKDFNDVINIFKSLKSESLKRGGH